MSATESILICEGFHDRSFLKGWLLTLGCTDPSQGGLRVRDPWGKFVTGGHFGFYDTSGGFLRVIPANSDDRCFSIAEELLKGRTTHPIRDLAIVVDVDESVESRLASCANLVARLGGKQHDPYTGLLEDGTRVRLAVLGEALPGPGVPQLSCLERTVCSAIAQAYPARAQSVAGWIGTVGNSHGPSESAKAHSWSYMAGWFPSFGCDAFYQEIWRDELIRGHLTKLLESCEAWKTVEKLVKDEL